jgi:hypothetical protein
MVGLAVPDADAHVVRGLGMSRSTNAFAPGRARSRPRGQLAVPRHVPSAQRVPNRFSPPSSMRGSFRSLQRQCYDAVGSCTTLGTVTSTYGVRLAIWEPVELFRCYQTG